MWNKESSRASFGELAPKSLSWAGHIHEKLVQLMLVQLRLVPHISFAASTCAARFVLTICHSQRAYFESTSFRIPERTKTMSEEIAWECGARARSSSFDGNDGQPHVTTEVRFDDVTCVHPT